MENIQLAYAFCKIGIYSLFRKLCCKKPPPPRPEFAPVCIGITGAGKTTLLALICGHSTDDIKPTTGFEIKACQFKKTILNVKEIGGGEKVRPYWKHYFSGAEGVVFVVDSAASEEELDVAAVALNDALSNPMLRGQPCLILGNCQDKPGARNEEQLKNALDLECAREGRQWILHLCSKNDVSGIREGFEKFSEFLLPVEDSEGDVNEAPGDKDMNRL